jgi:acetamidase/formamidase
MSRMQARDRRDVAPINAHAHHVRSKFLASCNKGTSGARSRHVPALLAVFVHLKCLIRVLVASPSSPKDVMRRLTVLVTLVALAAAAVDLHAETHRFVPTLFYNTFSAGHPPVLRIKSGDRVITSTLDDLGVDAQGKTVATGPNPQTGPFFVEGAEPGDLLVVTIEKLEPNRASGSSLSFMAPNAVAPGSLSTRVNTARVPWTIDTAKGIVRFDLESVGRNTFGSRFASPALEMPLRPVLGSIGVAPPSQETPGTTASGPFGGNMVSAGLAPGTRVMLPVFQTGALLFLGHGHARQGDGGVAGTGVETSLDVEFSVEVVKKQEWPHSSVVRPSTVVGEFPQGWPRVEAADYVMAVGTATDMLQALQHATLELHHWLDDDFGLSERAVNVFLGQAIEYEITSIADRNVTVVAKVRKSYLPKAP